MSPRCRSGASLCVVSRSAWLSPGTHLYQPGGAPTSSCAASRLVCNLIGTNPKEPPFLSLSRLLSPFFPPCVPGTESKAVSDVFLPQPMCGQLKVPNYKWVLIFLIP